MPAQEIYLPHHRKPGERRAGTAAVTGTYYVCLDCGTEFAYDWQAMEVVDTQRSGIKASRFMASKATQKAS